MRVLLLDINPTLCDAWRRTFAGVEDVQVRNDGFESCLNSRPGLFDCLVSPANSFGLMDGGMDIAIVHYFGLSLEERVQREIWQRFRGEQPVGTCLIVPTRDARCPFLAHCPTMQVPSDVSFTCNSYAAFLAALTTAEAAGVRTLACPGLGTAVGRMPADVAAVQMRYAYDRWKKPFGPPTWPAVWEHSWKSSGRPRREYLLRKLTCEPLDC